MTSYIGLAEKGDGGEYWIVFPDFPGCVSAGKDYDELYKNSVEALSLHIDGMKGDNEIIPKPRTLEEIRELKYDWCDIDGAIIMNVPYLSNQDKYVRINITINQRLLNKIDILTKNRSALLAKAVETYLDNN
jgi:predicted RNase H-like HicB family nuclease